MGSGRGGASAPIEFSLPIQTNSYNLDKSTFGSIYPQLQPPHYRGDWSAEEGWDYVQ
jgi:hypothetical protein